MPERGLREVYRKGRRTMEKAAQDDSVAEDFHEWHKQVKLLAAQLRWLMPLYPSALKPTVKKLDRIAEWLGAEHDLCVLFAVLSGSGFCLNETADLETIRRLLDARRNTLKKKALKQGVGLYKKTPAQFTTRLKRCRKRWHQAGTSRKTRQ